MPWRHFSPHKINHKQETERKTMSDTKHISEIIDNIGKQQSELANIFGAVEDNPATQDKASRDQLAEQSYRKTIRYWMDKISEAEYYIRKNQKKIESLYQ